jgi:hypothetical protein
MDARHHFRREQSPAANLGVLFGAGLIALAIIVVLVYAFG